ncbi:type II toxin-antitoxin system VapC family toxin [Phyllobacterium sp. UNC302MFCol5.2]|uniref:type II toxin-antitoxin system VapC family toxin n=1 Tax=Phyllobacterium sp. UNC302MFCol5.2 TaxID=1449065 RepID=UPI0004803821|nr:type II toxin-antitoxin system VapC family toxin [Phyllobacterium sp. UNC302MFCol5.2]
MKLLLDTHIALWIAEGSDGLSSKVIEMAANPDNSLYISAAAIWEISIKHSKGNLKLHPRDARSAFHLAGIVELPVSGNHAEAVASLPYYADHSDPFDRIMVAQALHEAVPLLTADAKLWRYHATLVIPA